jgi:alanine racemase
MAVVKADGYGHGAVPSARAALAGGADRLAVATADELETLRAGGIEAPVQVLGPLTPPEMARAVAAGGELTLWTPEAAVAAAGLGDAARPVPAHLKLDTGMGRLGARPETAAALADAASRPGLDVVGLMTHFAAADEPEGENAGFMREQLLRFTGALADLRPRFPGALVHAANSAATLRDPGTHRDMVRCGIALYGCSPFMEDPDAHDLRPAMEWVSWLASIKTIRSRESVGYGRTYRAARGTRIGLVPVGYADGYARVLSNRSRVLVGGRPVPVVGTISMDQLTVDLGPEGPCAVGDEAVLLGARAGERITAEELGRLAGTINYEVTCSVGARVPRAQR